MLNHATEYYTELFGPTDDHNIYVDPSLWEELEQVSEEENQMLTKPFSELEIKEALFQMKKQSSWT